MSPLLESGLMMRQDQWDREEAVLGSSHNCPTNLFPGKEAKTGPLTVVGRATRRHRTRASQAGEATSCAQFHEWFKVREPLRSASLKRQVCGPVVSGGDFPSLTAN